MLDQPATAISAKLRARASRIQCACFDVDGTLTNGQLLIDHLGRDSKAFHVQDGFGLRALVAAGIRVAWITARHSDSTLRRAEELALPVYVNPHNKYHTVRQLTEQWQIPLECTLFMGDDLPDLPALRAVGFAVAPANGHPALKPYLHWQTHALGGSGAVREVCDILLAAHDQLSHCLDRYSQ